MELLGGLSAQAPPLARPLARSCGFVRSARPRWRRSHLRQADFTAAREWLCWTREPVAICHQLDLGREPFVTDQSTIRVLGFAGSLRDGSYNRAALRTAVELAPAGMTIEIFDLAPIQPYNEDVKQRGFPPPEQELREKIRAADALLIVTPEYNRSMPGVLKNAIDWRRARPTNPSTASRPPFSGPARA
jgi:NADPH-dependent FMN reductase